MLQKNDDSERALMTIRKLTIELEEDLAEKLCAAAQANNWRPEDLAAECIVQHLEIATRHRVLVERFEAMDQHLATLARFVGQASASKESVDLWNICRYRGEKKPKP